MEHNMALLFVALCCLAVISGNEGTTSNEDNKFLPNIQITINKPGLTTTSPPPTNPPTRPPTTPPTRPPTPPTPPTQRPPNDCTTFRGSICHKLPTTCVCLVNSQKPWIDAYNYCKSDGRSLISFNSAAKQAEFQTYLPAIIGQDNLFTKIGFWTSGFYCVEPSALCSTKYTWAWAAFRENFSYVNWLAGEPNTYNSQRGACVHAVPTAHYGWDDIDCGQFLPFICV